MTGPTLEEATSSGRRRWPLLLSLASLFWLPPLVFGWPWVHGTIRSLPLLLQLGVAAVAILAMVVPSAYVVRELPHHRDDADPALRPRWWLAGGVACLLVTTSVVTLLLLTHDRQAYADDPLAAVASALMRAGPTMAVFTSGLFALVLRLRTRGQVEHENLTREYLDNMDSLRQKARDGDPFAIQTHVSYVMGFAERHGSRRREAIDVVCTYLRPAAQAGLPEPPVSYLRQRLVQHLRRRFAHLPPAGGAADWLYAGKLGPRGYWPGAVLDLRAARLEDLQLDCCRIAEVNLRDAQLSGATSFCRCVVERLASFAGAQFLHDADFGLVHLRRGASFDRATFFALADFTGGRFGAATTFRGVHFNGEVRFSPGAANVDLTDAFVRTATVAQGRLRLPSGWGVDMDRPVGGCYPIVHSAGRIPEQRPAASEERAA